LHGCLFLDDDDGRVASECHEATLPT
jgi:hypothetical protein